MSDLVTVDVADGIATIRLNRPPMNALSREVQEGLREAAAAVTSDANVAAVVLFGGEKVFAAGADVKEMNDMTYTQMVDVGRQLQSAFTAIADIPKPTVAAITGYALGGGCELALCCDFRIAADNAMLGQPEILLGIIPGAGGTQRLPRLIGPAKAKDLIFSGRFVKADEALDIGLIDKVVPADEVYNSAVEWMTQYTKGAPYALRAAKEAIDSGLEMDLASGLEVERLHFTGLFATRDQKIGMESFVEHGPGKAAFEGS